MVRTQIYIPDEIHRDLRLISQGTGETISELLRQGARKVIVEKKVLARTKRAKKIELPSFRGGKKLPELLTREVIYEGLSRRTGGY